MTFQILYLPPNKGNIECIIQIYLFQKKQIKQKEYSLYILLILSVVMH